MEKKKRSREREIGNTTLTFKDKMNDDIFYEHFKKHLSMFKKRITKKQVLLNLSRKDCPFYLPSFDNQLGSSYLGLNGRKIVGGVLHFDNKYLIIANYFQYRHISKMVKIVKQEKW